MGKWKDLKPVDWGDLPQKLRNSIKPQMDSLEAAMTATNTPTPELVERLRKEIPYDADGFRELRDLADEAAAAIANLTAERDDYKLKYNHECNRHDLTQKRVQQLDADRVAIVEANKLLSERVAVLETALEPLKQVADAVFSKRIDGVAVNENCSDDIELFVYADTIITFGDLRRALAVREEK